MQPQHCWAAEGSFGSRVGGLVVIVSLTERLEREFEEMPVELADGALAGLALAMAERIDENRGSPSECGKVLSDVLAQLRALAPPKQEADRVDDIGDMLAERRKRVAAASDSSRS